MGEKHDVFVGELLLQLSGESDIAKNIEYRETPRREAVVGNVREDNRYGINEERMAVSAVERVQRKGRVAKSAKVPSLSTLYNPDTPANPALIQV